MDRFFKINVDNNRLQSLFSSYISIIYILTLTFAAVMYGEEHQDIWMIRMQ